MKVQTKIILLLMALIAIFLVGLWAFRAYDQRKFRQIADHRFVERHSSFEQFLGYNGQSLKILADDYTLLDQVVAAIDTNDLAWFEADINTARLNSFHANAAWVYRTDGTLVHQVDNLNNDALRQVPVPPQAFAQIFAGRSLVHFFARVPQPNATDVVVEIRGGTIHPSKDFDRKTAPAGYFFAARVWNQPLLQEMSLFTGNEVSMDLSPAGPGENVNDEQNGLIVFSRPLHGWDGKPIANLVVRNESPVVTQLNRSSERLRIWVMVFALVLLLLLTVSLTAWVQRPLRLVMDSLQRGDPAPVAPMFNDTSEFGELARTIRKFFEQRDNLFREMEERRATEEALRKSEEELRQSQKMEAVGRLAGGVAHDFNNLLTAIIGYAELIGSRDGSDSLVRQHADLIRKAGEQAATLTKQLLAFSRKQLMQPKVLDLNHLVVDMERLLRRVIGERYHLKTRPEAKLGTVLADPTQIEQVILNLGVNARDAMPNGGDLVIRTANVFLDRWKAPQISSSLAEGEYVELSVSDTGIGMDDETKSRIFEPFFTTKGPGKGTGLGLATVYGVVRQTGGGISVESDPGKGTTFRIYLPLERSPVDIIKTTHAPLERSQNYETVLVVEDEEVVRDLVCDVLAEHGYNVLCAPDGIEALKMAREYDGMIHLMVTDVIMPHMNGPEVAEQLAATRPDMKVLYVTGYSDNDIGNHGVLEEGVELLQKPFTPQTLARKVRDVIQESKDVEAAKV
jgi:signal transduction histidine kinase/CheY-like chemotaxis protein